MRDLNEDEILLIIEALMAYSIGDDDTEELIKKLETWIN